MLYKEDSIQIVNKIFHNSCHNHQTNAHSINHSVFAIHCYLPFWFSATTSAIPAALFSSHQKEEAWLPSHGTKYLLDINKAHCLNICIQPKYFSLMHINILNIFQCGIYLKISLKIQLYPPVKYLSWIPHILSKFIFQYQHSVVSIQTLIKISLFWSRKK